jgi:hypothetical protein
MHKGYGVIPVPFASKNPGFDGWPHLRLTEDDLPRHFNGARQNLSIVTGPPSDNIADVDADCREAVVALPHFLPHTDAVFGHKDATPTHRLYCVTDPPFTKTRKYEDPMLREQAGKRERARIAELRWTGGHTLVPPSVYPNGDTRVWTLDGEPATVDGKALEVAVSKSAAAALLARYWVLGKRHDLALATAGMLLRHGWGVDDLKGFLRATCEAAGDTEVDDRITAVDTTAEKLRKGEKATGAPTLAKLLDERIADAVTDWLNLRTASVPGTNSGQPDDASGKQPPQRDRLVEIGLARLTLWHAADDDGAEYCDFDVGGHYESHRLHTTAVRKMLTKWYRERYAGVPGAQAMQEALVALGGHATFDGDGHAVHIRLAGHADKVYLFLADAAWRVVEISATGWRTIAYADCPVKFRKPKGMLPLPEPQPGGSLVELRGFLNAKEDRTWVLALSWLVGTYNPRGPRPVLGVGGEMGSAKTTLSRALRALIDPNIAPVRRMPRDDRDLAVAASNAHVCAFDNVSGIPAWLSDAFCSLATGGGFSTRKLYEDDEEVIFSACRPVLLNGIEDFITRDDLTDRAVPIVLPTIPEEERRDEQGFWEAFEAARPRILGALLDAVCAALANLSTTRLDRMPRMADFARWVAAAALPWEAGTFMTMYAASRDEAALVALDDSPLATALFAFLSDPEESWKGTASHLLERRNAQRVNGQKPGEEQKPPDGWPKKPNGLSGMLRRLAPNLRIAGLDVTFTQEGHEKIRTIHLTRMSKREQKCKPSSAPSASSAERDFGSNSKENGADDHRAGADDADDHAGSADDPHTTPSPARRGSNSKGNEAKGASADGADDGLPSYSDATRAQALRAADVPRRVILGPLASYGASIWPRLRDRMARALDGEGDEQFHTAAKDAEIIGFRHVWDGDARGFARGFAAWALTDEETEDAA